MPLLEIIQTRQVTASIRLDEPTAALIDQYAAFLHATADEVVDKALCYVFAKDRDFQEWRPAMVRARAASRTTASIPFGAAHRVYFDTPPLVGNCPDTLVSRQIPLKTLSDDEIRYLARYRAI